MPSWGNDMRVCHTVVANDIHHGSYSTIMDLGSPETIPNMAFQPELHSGTISGASGLLFQP